MSHENIMRLWNDAATGGFVRPLLRIITKTSAYTVTPADYGSVFTTRGATAEVWFTLPSASSVNKGNWCLFVNVANQNMFVKGTDDGLVTFNNLTSDNVGFSSASKLIGGAFLAISDGTSWLVMPIAEEAQSIAVNVSSTPTSSSSKSTSSSVSKSTSGTLTTSKSATLTGTGASETQTQTDTATITGTATDTATSTATSTATITATSTATA